jgi:prepilin-type N-terminal cleavage/methylation domain-containing protein
MRSKSLPRAKSRGFTLLEVLLVIVLLVAVFFPLLQMLSSGLLVSNEVKGTNTAVILAQQKIESLKNTAFDSIASESKATIESYPAYSRRVLVSSPQTNLKDVKVIVYWRPDTGSETSVSVETFISNF